MFILVFNFVLMMFVLLGDKLFLVVLLFSKVGIIKVGLRIKINMYGRLKVDNGLL